MARFGRASGTGDCLTNARLLGILRWRVSSGGRVVSLAVGWFGLTWEFDPGSERTRAAGLGCWFWDFGWGFGSGLGFGTEVWGFAERVFF